jgi:peptidoglycan/LPS O-acetylase OafA/YrhL
MFGYFRFVLATFVFASHVGISVQQHFNLGVFAVVCFFILAGFVVTGLFDKFFYQNKILYFEFYFERFLRIFPQYLFILALTVIFLLYTKFLSVNFDGLNVFSNLSIILLNLVDLIDIQVLVPPAWSLGLELKAYLILPFVIYFKLVKIIMAISSLVVFFLAILGFINTDLYSYNMIPGVFFMFILGVSTYNTTIKRNHDPDLFDRYFPVIVYFLMALLIIGIGIHEKLLNSDLMEIGLGVMLGFPAIVYIAKSNINIPFNKFFGDLSYGLFLSHFLVIWMVAHFFGIDLHNGINESNDHISPYLYVIMIFVGSIIISILGLYFVERPIKKYRFHLTKNLNKQHE